MTLTSGALLPHSHDFWLVALSVLIAVVAAYTPLDFAGRVTMKRGRELAAWLRWCIRHGDGDMVDAFHRDAGLLPASGDLPALVADALRRWKIPSEALVFEIAETVLMERACRSV